MAHLVIYGAYTNFRYRLVNPFTEMQWSSANGDTAGDDEMQASPGAYDETTIEVTRDDDIAGFPITIPSDVPAGEYDLLVYDAASPANTDNPSLGKRVVWNGSRIVSVASL